MVKIFDQVKQTTEENILFSPFCLSTSLAMVSQGSGGETLKQFEEVFEKTFLVKHGFQHASRLMTSNWNFRQELFFFIILNV